MNMQAKFKFLVLSMALATAMMLPMNVNAQRSDDFFRVNDDFGGTRTVTYWTASNGISNNGIGQSEAPVGSGLLILTAVGAGYAISRRKRNFKNGATLLLAFALLLGMTQCKKNAETINPVGNGVHITLRVDDGSRASVTPGSDYAEVTFDDGDIIYVGYNNACIGALTYNAENQKFGGDVAFVTPVGDDSPLHFYFLGNKTPTITETTKYTVDIIDQTSKYPVISYNRSNEVYTGAGEYSATLFNYCSFMKFTTNNITALNSSVLCITGMNNTVTVDFNDNSFSYGIKDGSDGLIKMATSTDGNRWAIVLPQNAIEAGGIGSVYTDDEIKRYRGSRPEIAEIHRNEYLKDGKSLTLSVIGFSVSSSKKVFFSPGNLQATTTDNGANWTWHFAENQWDFMGNKTGSSNVKINGNGTVSSNGTVDLFAWVGASNTTWSGTVGSTGNAAMHGITNATTMGNATDYGNTIAESLKADWGEVIDDGNAWRTLNKDEWTYVLSSRKSGSTVNGISNARVTYANITEPNVNGIILFPDGVTIETDEVTSWGLINSDSSTPTRTQCTTAQWAALAAKGCVFLPEAGHRRYFSSKWEFVSGNYYWSSSYRGGSVDQAVARGFDNFSGETGTKRQRGCAVRLVCNAN